MKKSNHRQSVTFPLAILDDLDFCCERLGKNRSAIIADILTQAVPDLANMIRTAEASQDNPKSEALAFAIRQMNDFLENQK